MKKTLDELVVGDKVVVHGGHWSSKPSLATVESATPARVVAGGVTYSRKTGRGPAPNGGRGSWGEVRKQIEVASEEDIKRAGNAEQKKRCIGLIRATNLEALPLEVLQDVLNLFQACSPKKEGT